MSDNSFDFGAMLDDQMKGIKRTYKFGKAFNDDKLIIRLKKQVVEVMSDDNATVKAAWESGEAIAGLVEKQIKGGYEITVAGERAFCPFSQIDRYTKDPAEYIGRKFDFLVSDYSKDERGLNIVLSRRALLEVQAEALKEAMLERLIEGETLSGTVTRVLDFGAFVDLGGIEGLIPVREISWERIDNPASVLKSGDGVTVKVMRIDRDNGKISLSRRECVARVFKKSAEEVAAEETAAEVSAWMKEAEKKNANVGSIAGAFDKLGL